jgi:Na+/proline symporter
VIEIKKNPSRRDLLLFAMMLPVFFGIVGTLAWRAQSPRAALALCLIGAALTLIALSSRSAGRLVYLGWMYASYPIAWTVSHLILAVIYFVIATPIALMLRLTGHDPMLRKFDRAAKSYWVLRTPNRDGARYFRQF